MMIKIPLLSLLFLSLSSFAMADTISDEEIQKALAGIDQIRVLDESEPKMLSEVLLKEKVVKRESSTKASKKIVKKRYKKKVYKRKKVKEDLSDLPMVQTLGVVKTSESFELK